MVPALSDEDGDIIKVFCNVQPFILFGHCPNNHAPYNFGPLMNSLNTKVFIFFALFYQYLFLRHEVLKLDDKGVILMCVKSLSGSLAMSTHSQNKCVCMSWKMHFMHTWCGNCCAWLCHTLLIALSEQPKFQLNSIRVAKNIHYF